MKRFRCWWCGFVEAATALPDGWVMHRIPLKTYHFCSEECRESWRAEMRGGR